MITRMNELEPAELEPALSVLLLAGQFEVRGASEYTIRLLRHLERYAVQARAVCRSAAMAPYKAHERLPIREYPYLALPLVRRWAIRRLVEDVGRTRPDLIHVQT